MSIYDLHENNVPVTISCRVRSVCNVPLEFNTTTVHTHENGEVVVTPKDNRNRPVTFHFDRCHGPSSTNTDVFLSLHHTLVQRPLAGYTSCFLCYGHTNAGKTHTVFGNPNDPGIAFRSLTALLSEPKILVSISFFEIYNDAVYDLLLEGNNNSERDVAPPRPKKVRANGGIEGQRVVSTLDCGEDNNPAAYLMDAITIGIKRRNSSGTWRNSQSSRSHGVLQIHVAQYGGDAIGQV
eukprot:PhF_6_TR26147/c0_g2_i2/m.37045